MMKMTIILMLVLYVFQTFESPDDRVMKRQRYKHMISGDFYNCIEASANGSFDGGRFYGTEFQEDGTPIYYLSDLDDVTSDRKFLSFRLKKYHMSYDRWEKIRLNKQFEPNGQIPLILSATQDFSGEIHGDSLVLKRTSELYDSRVDDLTFVLDRD